MRTTEEAKAFIGQVELPPRELAVRAIAQDGEAPVPVFSNSESQSVVVGSDVVSFVGGVEADLRSAVANSLLLAQLAARKKVPDGERIFDWYDAYFDTLQGMGWGLAAGGFSKVEESAQGFEVHEKIMLVAASLLGPGATVALAVVQATVDALKAAGADNGWITIFDRETLHASAARFQMAIVQPAEGVEVVLKLMAFGIEAKKTVTQVLLFRIKKSQAMLRKNEATLGMARDTLLDVAEDIRVRVRDFQRAFIASVEI